MLSPEQRLAEIRTRLTAALNPQSIEVRDDSHQHRGHVGAADGRGHYSVSITAAVFVGMGLLARHRAVYAALGTLMQTDIHALAIAALAPDPQ